MKKMNGLYIAAFVLVLVSGAFACGAIAAAYLLKATELAVLLGAAGTLCAFVGVIFAYKSKPKKDKPINAYDKS